MGHWLAGQKNTSPPASKLRVSTSIQGVVRPIVWGQTRISVNLIDYQDFKAHVPSGGKGGQAGVGGKGNQTTSTTYTATVVAGVCEGPILALSGLWENKSFGTAADFGWTSFLGSYSQNAWGYMTTAHPDHALNYRGLAYLAEANKSLGTSPELPQIGVEVVSSISFALTGPPDNYVALYTTDPTKWPHGKQTTTPLTPTSAIPDANPRDVIVDFLTNPHYGAQWPAARLDTSMADYSSACLALGLLVSPALVESTDGYAFLQSIADSTHAGFRWSSGVLTLVPWYDQAVTSGALSFVNEAHVVPSPAPSPSGNVAQPTVQVGTGNFVLDNGVVDSGTLVPFIKDTYSRNRKPAANHYTVSPSGLYAFSSSDTGRSITISYEIAAQASYQPDTTPIYDISDFLPPEGGKLGGQVVSCTRKPTYYQEGSVKLEWLDRNNNYDPSVVEVKDQAAIDTYGLRNTKGLRQGHMFCLGAAATMSATLQLQREKIPNIYTFTVGPQYIPLDVEDLVTLTWAPMGLSAQPVRITEITENESGTLTITAEEYMGTVGPPLYGTQQSVGAVANYNTDPGNINDPWIFQPPDALTGGLEIWGAVSGRNLSVWGGCFVWASYDNVNYAQVGKITGPSRMGVTTSELPIVPAAVTGNTIDSTNILGVDLTESAGELLSASAVDFAALNTRCWIGASPGNAMPGEVVAYQNATLTATSKYNLTPMIRGGFGSLIADHLSGSPFARLDSNIFSFSYDQSRIGSTVYFKFQSFNLWGGGLQDLSAVGAESFVIQGQDVTSPLPDVTNIRNYFEAGFMKIYWDEVDDLRSGIVYEIRKGTSWAAGLTLGSLAHPPFIAFGDDTFWISARWTSPQGVVIYSPIAQSISIQGSVLTPNVIKSWDEKATGWPGIFTGGTIKQGADPNAFVTLNAGVSQGIYEVPGSHWIDVGYVAPTSIAATWVGTGTPAGQDILSISDILSVPDILGGTATSLVDVHLDIAVSQLGPTTATIPFANAQYTQAAALSAWQGYDSPAVTVLTRGVGVTGASSTTTVGTAATGTTVTLASVANMRIGDAIRDTTGGETGAIPAGTNITNIVGLVVTLSQAVVAPGVSNGATIVTSAAGLGGRPIITTAIPREPSSVVAQGLRPSPGTIIYTQFGPWQKFVPGVYVGRMFKMRMVLETFDATTAVPNGLSFTWQAIVDLRVDHYQSQVTSAVSNTTITFKPDGSASTAPFNFGPAGTSSPYVSFGIINALQGDTVIVDSLSLSAITFHVVASGGGQVSRTVNVTAEGA